MTFKLRDPCKYCGHEYGHIENRNGQDCVFCGGCGRHCYNAPKTETGRKPRSVSTTHSGIKPKQQARIFDRASGRCEICGSREKNRHVGHIVSVADGHYLGMTDAEINDDENLMCLCEECNLGGGARTISLHLAVAILRARLHGGTNGKPEPI